MAASTLASHLHSDHAGKDVQAHAHDVLVFIFFLNDRLRKCFLSLTFLDVPSRLLSPPQNLAINYPWWRPK